MRLEDLAGPSTWRQEAAPWCSWTLVSALSPGVSDVELLEEALVEMPVYRPAPEDLAFVHVYSHLADFL